MPLHAKEYFDYRAIMSYIIRKQNESIEILQKQAGRVETILGLDPIQKDSSPWRVGKTDSDLFGVCDFLHACVDVFCLKLYFAASSGPEVAGVESSLNIPGIFSQEEDGESSPASPDSPGMVLKGGILLTDQRLASNRCRPMSSAFFQEL